MHVDLKDKSTSSSLSTSQAQEKTLNSFLLNSNPAICSNFYFEKPSQPPVRALSAVQSHVDLEGSIVRRLPNVNHP